jgi:hypothetical protein
MASALESASPEVKQFHDDCCNESYEKLVTEFQSHPAMQARSAGASAAGFSLDFQSVSGLVRFVEDAVVLSFGEPLDRLIVASKDGIRQLITQKTIDLARQLLNDLSDHPVMGAIRAKLSAAQGPPQAGHAASGA